MKIQQGAIDHAQVGGVGVDDHHAQLHAAAHASGGADDLGALQIVTGIYTGDGTESQVISGLGITPKYVQITERHVAVNNAVDWFWTIPDIIDDFAGKIAVGVASSSVYTDDAIIALASGQFTVDDDGADQHPNTASQDYAYWVLGY